MAAATATQVAFVDDAPPKKPGICENVLETIGNTPMVWLNKVTEGCVARVAAKLESREPVGSVKDRVGLALIEDAEARGILTPGETALVEATSGNTGISMAQIAAIKGYKMITVMPDAACMERKIMAMAFGAKLVLSDCRLGVQGAMDLAESIEHKQGAVQLKQFANPIAADVHERTTGPEIWRDTAGNVDIMVSAAGTGGTMTGLSRYLKSKKPSLHMVVVEPDESAVLSGDKPGPHKIIGIGAGFVPPLLDRTAYDEVVRVKSDDAAAMTLRMFKEEGLSVGVSAGAAVVAAVEVAKRPENAGKLVAVLLPSFGERYLTTYLFEKLRTECEQMTFEP